jgi:hypothetical protein
MQSLGSMRGNTFPPDRQSPATDLLVVSASNSDGPLIDNPQSLRELLTLEHIGQF